MSEIQRFNSIRYWRELRGLSREQLAKAIGKTPPYITMLQNGERVGDVYLYADMAKILGVTIEQLIAPPPGGPDGVTPEYVDKDQPRYAVPVTTRIVAGVADEAIENVNAPTSYIYLDEGPQDGLRPIDVAGDSMEPELRRGDCIVVRDVAGESEVSDGDIVVAIRYPESDTTRQATIKVYARVNGARYLIPLNESGTYRAVPMDDTWRIASVAVKIIKRNVRRLYPGRAVKFLARDPG